jgi:hypothetical protein
LPSCKEDDTADDAAYLVTITIIEPVEHDVYTSGDELHMEVDFERAGVIHFVEILALNETSGDTIYYSGAIHADASDYYGFHEHVDVFVSGASDCKLVASTWEHDPLEKISEEVHFTVNP